MTTVRTTRATLDRLRAALAPTTALYEVRDDDWEPADAAVPFDWATPRPFVSPKRFFFPARDPLLRWDPTGAATAVTPAVAPFALVGLRACDATAIAVQDRFFAADPRYRRRRDAALLVAVDCATACAGGFCRDVDAGPFAAAGCDLAFTPLAGDAALVTSCTPTGAVWLERLGCTGPDAADARAVARAAAAATFPDRPFIERTIARLDGRTETPPSPAAWRALGPSCLACSGCTSLCPTCTCWAQVDEPDGDGGTRARVWDSCLLDGFQREAGGHPAPDAADRVRRFWEHKLSPAFVPALGRLGCVGCGRCDVTCPGSIGALRVTAALGA